MSRVRFAAVSCLIASSGRATTLVPMDLDQLIAASDAIVVGTVSEALVDAGPSGEIYTFIVVRELELVRGDYEGDALILRSLGGETPEASVQVIGAPVLEAGDRVILFVEGNGEMIVPFVGLSQGVLWAEEIGLGVESPLRDSLGRRLLAIDQASLIWEALEPSGGSGDDEMDAGVPDDGLPSVRIDLDPFVPPEGPRPTLRDAIRAIRNRSGSAPAPRRALLSVPLFLQPAGEFHRDVAMPRPTDEGGPETAPREVTQ